MELRDLLDLGHGRTEFKALLRPHMKLLHGKALSLCGSPDRADALLQEVLRELAGRVDTMKKLDNPAPWIMERMYRRYQREYRKEAMTQ